MSWSEVSWPVPPLVCHSHTLLMLPLMHPYYIHHVLPPSYPSPPLPCTHTHAHTPPTMEASHLPRLARVHCNCRPSKATLSPWCNCPGWLGVKHKVTYLLTPSLVSDVEWSQGNQRWTWPSRWCHCPVSPLRASTATMGEVNDWLLHSNVHTAAGSLAFYTCKWF